MRRKVLLVLLAVLLICAVAGTTLAYFTSRATVNNVFTIGSVKIALEEPSWDPSDAHIIAPGAVFQKDPIVTNTGNLPAYVRVNVTVSDYGAFMDGAPVGFQLSQLFGGYDDTKWTLSATAVDNGADSVTFSYRFNDSLAASDNTGPLFTSVQIPVHLTAANMARMEGDFTITVTADAIQTETFTGPVDAFAAFDAQTTP